MVLILFCSSVDPIECLAEVINYSEKPVLIELENSRQKPSFREFRYMLAERRINRVLGEVTARNLGLKTSWKTEDPTLSVNSN